MLGLVIVILKSVIFTPDTVQQFDVKKKTKGPFTWGDDHTNIPSVAH